jgi:hypothetical protein
LALKNEQMIGRFDLNCRFWRAVNLRVSAGEHEWINARRGGGQRPGHDGAQALSSGGAQQQVAGLLKQHVNPDASQAGKSPSPDEEGSTGAGHRGDQLWSTRSSNEALPEWSLPYVTAN